MRNVAFLTHEFYPNNVIGSHRPFGLAKYLPQFGWKPYVICARWTPQNCKTFDQGLYDKMKRISVFKAVHYERTFGSKWDEICYALRLLQWPRVFLMKSALSLFGAYAHWIPADFTVGAINAMRELAAGVSLSAVWATFPPSGPLTVADWANKAFNIPWIADFRDTLEQKYLMSDLIRSKMLLNETKIVKSSGAIVTVSQPLADKLEARHQKKVKVITNGYDPEEYDGNDIMFPDVFTITYTGRIILGHRDPGLFLEALGNLIDQGHVNRSQVAVRFVGSNISEILSLTERYPTLLNVVCVEPWVARRQSLRLQQQAHVLLHLVHAQESGILTGKIFEYLAARRPILCIPGDKGVVESLLHQTQAGAVCRTVEETRAFLLEAYRQWQTTGMVAWCGNAHEIAKYSRREQAMQLAHLLDIVADSERGGVPFLLT